MIVTPAIDSRQAIVASGVAAVVEKSAKRSDTRRIAKQVKASKNSRLSEPLEAKPQVEWGARVVLLAKRGASSGEAQAKKDKPRQRLVLVL